MEYRILARQHGDYNEREVEDALLAKEAEDERELTRFTASRHGEYIFIVTGTAPEKLYPEYKRLFGISAVTFEPSEPASGKTNKTEGPREK
jgi:hypothetical protein